MDTTQLIEHLDRAKNDPRHDEATKLILASAASKIQKMVNAIETFTLFDLDHVHMNDHCCLEVSKRQVGAYNDAVESLRNEL